MHNFCWFSKIFCALQTPKSTASVTGKTGPINQQNRSINQNSVRFTDMIQIFRWFEFYTSFQPVFSVFGYTDYTGPIFGPLPSFQSLTIGDHAFLAFLRAPLEEGISSPVGEIPAQLSNGHAHPGSLPHLPDPLQGFTKKMYIKLESKDKSLEIHKIKILGN
jgi:hypothetical protein